MLLDISYIVFLLNNNFFLGNDFLRVDSLLYLFFSIVIIIILLRNRKYFHILFVLPK